MPLQNRVTPFGEIVAVAPRGLFTGNRGIIHDPSNRTLLKRRWTTRAWIICLCEFKGRRRAVMGGRSWTELFFLDEATALAAGHRPCFYCQRQRATEFRDAWAAGNKWPRPYAPDIDRVLHAERLDGRSKRLHPLPGPLERLPDGCLVTEGQTSYLVLGGRLLRWSASGYEAAPTLPAGLQLLTPPSIWSALKSGFRPVLHPTAGEGSVFGLSI
ncbi:MAG: hypothetical protein CTR53_11665 [Ferrovibrio sp.]|nr:MAG: hypothetical protein CTR53_11665 [Ferrovibrio sp.]